MSSLADKRTLAQRLGLDGIIVDPPTLGTRDIWQRRGTGLLTDELEGLDWECPYCGKSIRLVAMDSAQSYDRFYPDKIGVDVEERVETEDGTVVKRTYFVCECPRKTCKGKIFAVVGKFEDGTPEGTTRIVESYPYPNVSATTLSASIPRLIREDFAEASRCFYAHSYKGVVVLCRRVVQDIVIHLKETEKIEIEGRDPAEQIKELWRLGAITKDMFDTATHITQFGGFGAHPQNDGLDNISPALAERILEVTNQFLEALFVMRGRNKEFNKHIQEARQKPKPNTGI